MLIFEDMPSSSVELSEAVTTTTKVSWTEATILAFEELRRP
jgi:hypothetical protein